MVAVERVGWPQGVVRPGAIYGPGETRLLKLFRAIARGRYAVVGSGRPLYHPVYIDDLVAGFLLALDHPRAPGEAFILAGPSSISQADLASLIARKTGGRVLPVRIPAALCGCVGLNLTPVALQHILPSLDQAERLLHRDRIDFVLGHDLNVGRSGDRGESLSR